MSAATGLGRMRPLLSGVVLRSQSDAQLTVLAADGHQAAFCTIFERYERELRAHAARMVRSSRVDDVLQHTMLSAWSALLAGSDVGHLRSWLHRIVHNAALSTVTRRGYDDDELPEAMASPGVTEDLVQGRLTAGEALAAIAALPEGQRRALTLTVLEGDSARDAAAKMGVSENALRQLVFRARTGVRSAVSAVTPTPLLLMAAGHGGGGSASLATAGALGGAGGVTLKAAAVLVVAAGTLGAAGSLPGHHGRTGPQRARAAPATTHAAAGPTTSVEPVVPVVSVHRVAASASGTRSRGPRPGSIRTTAGASGRQTGGTGRSGAGGRSPGGEAGGEQSGGTRRERPAAGADQMAEPDDPVAGGDATASAPAASTDDLAPPTGSFGVSPTASGDTPPSPGDAFP